MPVMRQNQLASSMRTREPLGLQREQLQASADGGDPQAAQLAERDARRQARVQRGDDALRVLAQHSVSASAPSSSAAATASRAEWIRRRFMRKSWLVRALVAPCGCGTRVVAGPQPRWRRDVCRPSHSPPISVAE